MKLHNLQIRVRLWMEKCFGFSKPTSSTQERCDRFLEECLELLQACGYDKSRIATLVNYTFSRPIGEVHSEVGGVLITLAALCNNQMVFMDDAASNALDYINRPEVMQKIRDKQISKDAIHDESPLPGGTVPSIELTSKSAPGHTIEDYRRAGWTDELLVEHGYAQLIEPIPSGIYYSLTHDNFYDSVGNYAGQGNEFRDKWYARRTEFPQRGMPRATESRRPSLADVDTIALRAADDIYALHASGVPSLLQFKAKVQVRVREAIDQVLPKGFLVTGLDDAQMAQKFVEMGKGVNMLEALCKALNMTMYIDSAGKMIVRADDQFAQGLWVRESNGEVTYHHAAHSSFPDWVTSSTTYANMFGEP